MAHVGAEPVSVRVGGVLAPKRAFLIPHDGQARFRTFPQAGTQLFAARLQQRATHAAVAVAHGAESARTGTHDGAHVEALHAVIGGVRREDAAVGNRRGSATAQLDQSLIGRAIALAPGNGLHVAAFSRRQRAHVDGACEQRNAQKFRQARDERRIGVGRGPAQPMVHMQDAQRPQNIAITQVGGQVRKRRGVRPARHHQQHRGIRRRQPPPHDASLHPFENLHLSPFPFSVDAANTRSRQPARSRRVRRTRNSPSHVRQHLRTRRRAYPSANSGVDR